MNNKAVLTPSKSLKETIETMLGQLIVGENKIDTKISIRGLINKQDDFEQVATAKALSIDSIACLIRHCGITREYALKTLIAMALNEIQPNEKDVEFANEFKALIASKLPMNKVNGRSTGKLDIEIID